MKNQIETPVPGDIQIDDQVICEYVADAVLEFEGVSRLSGSYIDNFQELLGRDTSTSGIKVNREDNNVSVWIHIIVYYGVNIPQLSYDIQNKIKEVIEKYVGFNVVEVNIDIEGIDKPNNKN